MLVYNYINQLWFIYIYIYIYRVSHGIIPKWPIWYHMLVKYYYLARYSPSFISG